MNRQIFMAAGILIALAPLHATDIQRRAVITGRGGEIGKCTIEVDVDGAAEVEVRGDSAVLRTLGGQTAVWRRFQCTDAMPRQPADFRFVGVDGRGSVLLLRDPRNNGGRATVRIDDRQGGREGYTFDLEWRLGQGGFPPPNYPPPNPGPPYPGPPDHGPGGPGGGGFSRAIQACQDSVANRLLRDGFSRLAFDRTIPDDKPGRNDWVIGTVSGKRGWGTTWFRFSCSLDFRSGDVRSVDVRPR